MSYITFEMDSTKANVLVCYQNESVSFSMTYYKKGRDNHDVMAAASPFLEFNEWLKTKPAQWHREIFEIYKDIKQSILEINDVNRLIGVLNKHFIKIYAKVNLDEMKHWITLPNTPVYVSNKKETNYDPQTTYVYQDYLDLVTYSLALRFVAPIWGDIHNRLNSEFGKDAKEVYSMEILYDTCMVSNPEKNYICTAENRLREFIANTKLKLETNAVLVSGLSEDDFYNYLYSVIILKKIAQGDISGNDDSYHLIAQTYFFLSNKIKQASKSYGADSTQIQMKKNPVEDKKGNESNSQSVLDVGFVRSRLLADEKMFLKLAISDHQRLIQSLCPDLPEDLYLESMDNIMQMNTNYSYLSEDRQYMKPIQDVQLTITKWIVHRSVNTVIFDHLELNELINLIGLVRAILWHKGFHEFAAVISAIALQPNRDSTFVQPSYRKNLEAGLSERLAKTYDLGGITKSEKRNMSYIGCIELIHKGLFEYNWLLTLPEKWLEESNLVTREKRLILPSDIRNKIGELMLVVESEQEFVQDEFN